MLNVLVIWVRFMGMLQSNQEQYYPEGGRRKGGEREMYEITKSTLPSSREEEICEFHFNLGAILILSTLKLPIPQSPVLLEHTSRG